MRLEVPTQGAPIAEGSPNPIHRVWRRWIKGRLLQLLRQRLIPTDVQTANYNANVWDLVLVDPSGGGFDVTFPEGTDGEEIAVKNVTGSGNDVDLVAPSGWTIEGGAQVTTNTANAAWHYVADADRKEWIEVCQR